MVYDTKSLFEDAARRGARGRAGSSKDLAEVWACIDAYAADCLDRRRGLVIPNFCKLGWMNLSLRGKTAVKPYFHLCDAYCRAIGIELARVGPHAPDKDLFPMEEFNFSKAAIKFSQGLTKDNVFVGLKLLMSQLAEVIGRGTQVNLEMSFGKFVAREKCLDFVFSPVLLLANGLPVSADAEVDERAVPRAPTPAAPTFAAPTRANILKLNLAGSGMVASGDASDREAFVAGAATDDPALKGPVKGSMNKLDVSARMASGTSRRNVSVTPERAQPSLVDQDDDRQPKTRPRACSQPRAANAYEDALHREITNLELRGSEAMRDRQALESQVSRRQEQVERQHAERKEQLREHADFLQQQINEKKQRLAASGRDGPELPPRPPVLRRPQRAEIEEPGLTGLAIGEELLTSQSARGSAPPRTCHSGSMSARLPPPGQLKLQREDLDKQLEIKRAQQNAVKESERMFERKMLQYEQHKNQAERSFEQEVRAKQAACLQSAWSEGIRMKEIRRTIEAIETGSAAHLPKSAVTPRGAAAPLSAAAALALQPVPLGVAC